MKKIKKALSLLLVLAMVLTLLPASVLANPDEPAVAAESVEIAPADDAAIDAVPAETDIPGSSIEAGDIIDETVPEEPEEDPAEIDIDAAVPALAAAQPQAVTMDSITKTQSVPLDTSKFYTIFHLDCGRNYFSVQQIENIIDEMAKDGYNTLELAVGNDALRLVLDDMSVTANGTTYDSTTVANAVKNGNKSYRNNGTNELTQSEMDTIISYANSKGIAIIPLVNAPGHANSILAALKAVGISNPAYGSDPRTIDVRNAEAVNFTLALVNKYIQYFAGKGCKIFNMGADEYANTTYGSGSMGFGHLQSAGEYGYYADFVNNMAAQIQNAGMTAMAFNDGIYFNSKTTASFDSNIAIAYWSSGFGSYITAPASFLANKGHKIINTNDGWYYVMGRATGTYSYQTAINAAKNTKVTDIPGDNDPTAYGAMVCLWYDSSATYSESNTLTLISTLAENNKEYFVTAPEIPETPETPEVYEKTDATGTVSINTESEKVNITSVTMTPATVASIETDYVAYDVQINGGEYTSAATVTIALSDALKNAEKLTGFVVNADSTITYVAGTKSDDGNSFSFVAPHFSTVGVMAEPQADTDVEEPADQTINLKVGETNTITIADANYAGTYNPSPAGIATVTVTGQDKVDSVDTETAVTSVSNNTAYYIKNSSGQYLTADAKWTTTRANAVKWTVTSSTSWGVTSYTFKSGSNYLRYNNGWTTSTNSSRATALYLNNGTFYRTRGTLGSSYSDPLGQPITVTQTTGHAASTTITFGGVSAGTTYVTIGGTKYKVVVSKKTENVTIAVGDSTTYSDSSATSVVSANKNIATASGQNSTVTITGVSVGTTTVETNRVIYNVNVVAEDLSKVNPVQIEWWITNSPITSTDPNHSPDGSRTDTATNNTKTVYFTKLTAEKAYGENGVAISDVVPATGSYEYSGPNGCVFWKGIHLTSSNKQTVGANVDKTAVDDAATYIRYFNKKWQYSADRQNWKDIASTDQMVAYYLQATQVTKEVTTMTKDWGLAVGGQDGSTSQVALSVAVVYPDGTLSPAEGDIYKNSTLIFNYWSNRDIGIVAPVLNDDYEVEKMTVTPGSRVSGKTGIFTTASTDGINWEKKTTAAGTQWFNETTYWDESTGGAPMVNGATSNIKWSAANKAYLVLIYLKPVHHDSNLTVKWVDDTAGIDITSQEVVVDYTGSTAPTFLTDIVNNGKKGAPAGTIDLKDDAYIVNKAGVQQTFNKDLTVMPNIAGQYTSGLYQYVSADISADGKTLTLHYTMDASKLSNNYVVDFGLGVDVPLSDFGITNVSSITKVTTTSNASYANGTITFKPAAVMNGIETVTARVEFKSGNPQTLNMGFMPATSVYYEEGYASMTGFTGGSKGTAKQAKQVAGSSSNEYGYDAAYASNAGASAGSEAVSTAKNDLATLDFTGTGVDVYVNSTSSTANVTLQVINAAGKTVKLAIATTKANGAYGSEVSNAAYSTRVLAVKGLPYGNYTLKLSAGAANVKLDGFRVYGTLADQANQAYTSDEEDNPTFLEMRNAVLTAINAATADSASAYAQVFEKTNGQMTGALVTDVSSTDSTAAETMLKDGPKNELYLAAGQALTFKVTTNRKVQIGLKAPNGATTCTVNGTSKAINSSVDMFYAINSGTVTIQNTGSKVLSVTDLKVCDAPAVLGELTESDIAAAIAAVNAPVVENADATVNVKLADYTGKAVASTAITVNGVVGETATVAAADIQAAAQAVLPAGYGIVDVKADVTVAFGETADVTVTAGKVATLNITYKKGSKKVGTATLTAVQTSKTTSYTFSTSEIKAAGPAGYTVISLAGTSVKFGSSKSLNATCL